VTYGYDGVEAVANHTIIINYYG